MARVFSVQRDRFCVSGKCSRLLCSRSRQSGFTLLEVIIAFVIMALVFGAVFNTFSIGLRNATLAGDYAGAVVHAEAKLAQIGVEEPLEEGLKSGRFDALYGWQQLIRPVVEESETASETTGRRLYEVSVMVFWGSGRTARDLTLRTWRIKGDPGRITGGSGQ